MKYIFLLLSVQFFIYSCSTTQPISTAEITIKEIRISDSSYWLEVDPISFLDTLEKYGKYGHFVIETKPTLNWLSEKHVTTLMKKTNNIQPASIVFSIYESNVHGLTISTVGTQAKYLIEGFNKKRYPPSLCSYHYFDNK